MGSRSSTSAPGTVQARTGEISGCRLVDAERWRDRKGAIVIPVLVLFLGLVGGKKLRRRRRMKKVGFSRMRMSGREEDKVMEDVGVSKGGGKKGSGSISGTTTGTYEFLSSKKFEDLGEVSNTNKPQWPQQQSKQQQRLRRLRLRSQQRIRPLRLYSEQLQLQLQLQSAPTPKDPPKIQPRT